MKNKITKEILVPFTLIILAILLLNPFHFWMPDVLIMCVLVTTLVIFGMFASFVLKEKVFDERDGFNRSLAGRNAFLVGSAIIILAIIIQEYQESLDPWLIVVLVAMIIAKISTHFWSNRDL